MRAFKNLNNFCLSLISNSKLIAAFCFLLIISIYPFSALSVEITNYKNIYAEITGMFDSKEHGLVFSNSTGIYKINKITGVKEPIKSALFKYYSFKYFFEYNGELHFYRTNSNLFRIRNGVTESVCENVVGHYVLNGKLYLIRGNELRVQVIDNGESTEFSLGYNDLPYVFSITDIKGEVYTYIRLRNSNKSFLFKILNTGIEFLFDENHPDYIEFKKKVPISLHNINGELWINTFNGTYKFIDGIISKIDSNNTFSNKYLYGWKFKNGIIYGIHRYGIFKYNINSKEETLLKEISTDPVNSIKMIGGENNYYYVIDDSVFVYNINSDRLSNIKIYDNGDIIHLIEGLDENIIIAKEDHIEWYNNYLPKVFNSHSVFTNKFYGITYDYYNKKVVALGQSGRDFFVQFFDENDWTFLKVPFSVPFADSYEKANIECDLNGICFVSVDQYLGKWDGKNWEKISFLKNPDIIENQYEYNNVLFRDSLGGVWFSISTKDYNPDTKIIEYHQSLRRYINGKFELKFDLETKYVDGITSGICMRDGTCIFDDEEEHFIMYRDGIFKYIKISDGKDYPEVNTLRSLSLNNENQLVILFRASTVWSRELGSYKDDDGISVYDILTESWDHKTYKNIFLNYNPDINCAVILFDDYGKNWIVNHKKMVRINDKDSYSVFTVDTTGISFEVSYVRFVKIGNTFWSTTYDDGLFKLVLPDPATTVSADRITCDKILNSEITHFSKLELLQLAFKYSIFSISGEEVSNGINSQFIDVSNLTSGTYFIMGETSEHKFMQKFIVIR